jgi:hypothetical protein
MMAALEPLALVPDFDEETHTFRVDGRIVPSVTGILKAAGIGHTGTTDEGFEISEEVMEAARDRGTDAHLACQLLDESDLDWDSLDEEIEPYVTGYQNWKDAAGFVPDLIERPLYNETDDYCGIVDRAGWIGDERVVVDIKTGSGGLKPWHPIQTAAYAACIPGAKGIWPTRIVLVLKATTKKGFTEYRFSPRTAEWDYEVFKAARTIWTFKELSRKNRW